MICYNSKCIDFRFVKELPVIDTCNKYSIYFYIGISCVLSYCIKCFLLSTGTLWLSFMLYTCMMYNMKPEQKQLVIELTWINTCK